MPMSLVQFLASHGQRGVAAKGASDVAGAVNLPISVKVL